MNRVPLDGCTPTPLAGYLKAIGVLRLVSEQQDADARGGWENERFVMTSRLDRDALCRFLLEHYRPSPIIAPWNGGSGFYFREEKIKDPATGKNVKTGRRNQPTTATRTIDRLLAGESPRFARLRECVGIAKAVISELGLAESPKDRNEKTRLLSTLRARLPDSGLAPLDAAILIAGDDLLFPPLLGTGGTDGNLDFTNNFVQRLLELVDRDSGRPTPASQRLLDCTLFGGAAPGLTDDAIGMFSPGQAGGPNAATGYDAGSLMNPWDFVLMLEGSLLFAAAATRRLESEHPGALSFPFTVRPRGGGQGGVAPGDEVPARAEIWLPLWKRPAALDEIRGLFSEGRATLGRRSARDGLDFARAVSLLAVDRGIDGFQRYAFMMRAGKAFLATPLNRFQVPRRPRRDLIGELDRGGYWLDGLRGWSRREEAPGRIRVLAHRLDDSLFDLARSERPGVVQRTLSLFGEIQRYASTSGATREKLRPVPLLSESWFLAARDDSPEFRVATALAGLTGTLQLNERRHRFPLRVHLSPLDPDEDFPAWAAEGATRRLRVWNNAGLERNLAAVLESRLREFERGGLDDKPLGGRLPADLATVSAFLSGATDDRRIGRLLPGLAHCAVPGHQRWQPSPQALPLPVAYGLLKLLLAPTRQLQRCNILPEGQTLATPPGIIRLLTAGRVPEALTQAWRRLRVAGMTSLPGPPSAAGLGGTRLAAALLIPVTDRALTQLYKQTAHQDSAQKEAS